MYIAVGFDPEVIQICRGEHGLLNSGRRDGVVVVNSTCDPELMIELGTEFVAQGIEFLDIPLLGVAGPLITGHCWPWWGRTISIGSGNTITQHVLLRHQAHGPYWQRAGDQGN